MNNSKETVKAEVTILELTGRTIPLLEVTLSGHPTMSDVSGLMSKIREITENITGDYVSVTDMSQLQINKLFRSIILYGMEKAYKIFLKVEHSALLSFVILGTDENENRLAKTSLERINEANVNSDGAYRYHFIQDKEQIKELAGKLLKKIGK